MRPEHEDDQESVFQMMYRCNRPTSKTEVVAYFKGEMGGTAIQEALEGLEESGRLVTKVYGKSKIYLVNQELFQDEEDVELDKEIQGHEKEIKALREEADSVDAEIKMLEKMLSIEKLEESIESLDKAIKSNSERLEGLRSGGREVTKKDMSIARKGYEKAQSTLKKIRRTFNEVVERLSEGMDMKKSDLYEEIGIEA